MSIANEVMWDAVDSSNIRQIAYHEDSNRILVEFKDGGQYAYDDCDLQLYRRFQSAPSVGKFFHGNIKPKASERLN